MFWPGRRNDRCPQPANQFGKYWQFALQTSEEVGGILLATLVCQTISENFNLMNYPVSPTPSATSRVPCLSNLVIGAVLVAALAFGGYNCLLCFFIGAQKRLPSCNSVAAPAMSDSEDYESKLAHMVNGVLPAKWPVKADYPSPGRSFRSKGS